MTRRHNIAYFVLSIMFVLSCGHKSKNTNLMQSQKTITAKDILGNPNYQAISYGGYRGKTREAQPTVFQLKEDLKILQALNIKLVRTYNVQLAQASNLLKAISQLKKEDNNFEMYVMLGAWIDCKNAWTDLEPDHNIESIQNKGEIERAMALANQYPDIVKIIAVGNEAMVKWATSYYVQPKVILKWVNYLQDQKANDKLPKDLWITSSDDYASWGGGDENYRVKDLESLIKAVDFVSMHTYPYHNTHYNPEFWGVEEEELELSKEAQIAAAMERALKFAQTQFEKVSNYVKSIDSTKSVHIGETGWATISNGHYGPNGSKATDELKQAIYYNRMRQWTNEKGISCFYFEAFDEPWKDAHNDKGSENHFRLFTVDGKAKFLLWDQVDQGLFSGLKRDGGIIEKTYDGNREALIDEVQVPPMKPTLSVKL